MFDYRAQRLNMVESQLRTNKVTDDAVLAAFLAVPRERFVPAHLAGIAYIDEDVPLGGGRYLMEPMVLARLVQLAQIGPRDAVLEIGAGTGYATAILARLAGRVVAVECDRALIATARARMQEMQVGNVTLLEGPLEQGYPAGAPYEAIFINGAVVAIPDAVARQLGEDGRLVTVEKPHALGHGVIMTRTNGALAKRRVFDAGSMKLPGFEPAPAFVF